MGILSYGGITAANEFETDEVILGGDVSVCGIGHGEAVFGPKAEGFGLFSRFIGIKACIADLQGALAGLSAVFVYDGEILAMMAADQGEGGGRAGRRVGGSVPAVAA